MVRQAIIKHFNKRNTNTPLDKILKVRFYPRAARKKKQIIRKIYCTIRINKEKSKDFSTDVSVDIRTWTQKSQSSTDKEVNTALESLKDGFMFIIKEMRFKNELLTLENFFSKFKTVGILELGELLLEKKIAQKRAKSTLINNTGGLNNLRKFIEQKKKDDLAATSFTSKVASEYYRFLLKRYCHNTAVTNIRFVKEALSHGVSPLEKIEVNPLSDYKLIFDSKFVPKHLSSSDLLSIENGGFENSILQEVADCFLFQCYTGMAYIECMNFEAKKDIQTDENGRKWVLIQRQKVDSSYCRIPLLRKAQNILLKYNNELPIPSGTYYNKILKLIQAKCEINSVKSLSSHVARKTCVVMLLDIGVKLEIISEWLGNSTETIKKYYGRVGTRHIAREVERVSLEWN